MIRVAIVTDIFLTNIGGIERFTLDLAKHLAQRNMVITLYDRCSLNSRRPKWYDRFAPEAPLRGLQLGEEVIKKIAEEDAPPDVILQNGIAGWNMRRQMNIPRIVIHHGSWRGIANYKAPPNTSWKTRLGSYIFTNQLMGGLEQYSSRGAISVAVSSAVSEELEQYYKGIESLVIPNGIDIKHCAKQDQAAARQKYGLAKEDFVICFTGRYDMIKGFDVLQALTVKAWHEQPRMKFLVATDQILQGWPANTLFVKNVSYDEIPQIYSAANVFLFPTRYEGCSYSLIEAMACELPVVASLVGYAKDLRRDLNDLVPFILAESDSELYWQALKVLADSPDLVNRLGVSGAEYVRRHNSLDTMADSYEQLIEQVTQGRQRRGEAACSL